MYRCIFWNFLQFSSVPCNFRSWDLVMWQGETNVIQFSSEAPSNMSACKSSQQKLFLNLFFLMSTKTSFDFFVWELGNFDLTNLQNCVFWVLATAWVLKHGNQVLTCVTSGRKMKHTSATFTRQWAFLVGGRAMWHTYDRKGNSWSFFVDFQGCTLSVLKHKRSWNDSLHHMAVPEHVHSPVKKQQTTPSSPRKQHQPPPPKKTKKHKKNTHKPWKNKKQKKHPYKISFQMVSGFKDIICTENHVQINMLILPLT